MKRLTGIIVVACVALPLTGCMRDMQDQPKYKNLRGSDFFADGKSARDQEEGTVAQGQLRQDPHFFEGKVDGVDATTFPMPVDRPLLQRGQERFNIYCSVCHGRTGEGNGMVVQRGFPAPPSYHIERLKQAPVGYIYNVITNGFGRMYSYAAEVEPRDRWAIVAYIRALQQSQDTDLTELSPEERGELDKPAPAAAEPETGAHQ